MHKILNHPFWASHALLIARVLLGGFFLLAGVMKLTGGIDGTASAIAGTGLPVPMLLAWIVAFVETLGGAAIILGVYFKETAITLAVLVLLISIFMHNPADAAQQGTFLKNMALIGGLLYMAAHGAGNTWKLKLGK